MNHMLKVAVSCVVEVTDTINNYIIANTITLHK